MHRFSVFCVLLLQLILFAQPTVSQLDNDRIRKAFLDAGLLPKQDVFDFGNNVARSVKHCSTIKYPLDSTSFLLDICFNESSQELDAKLKVGDIDLGQAKGTFDGGVLISFDHGKELNGHHRYYMKGNELWLRYSNVISGKNDNGDFKLRSLHSKSSEDSGAPTAQGNVSKPLISVGPPKPEPKEDAKPTSSEDLDPPKPPRPKGSVSKPLIPSVVPKPEPKEDVKPMSSDDSGAPKPLRPEGIVSKPLISTEDSGVPHPGPKEDELKPVPREDEPKPVPKEDKPKPVPKEDVLKEEESKPGPKKDAKLGPKGNKPKPRPKKDASKQPKGNTSKPKPKGKSKPKGSGTKPKPKGNASKPKPKAEF